MLFDNIDAYIYHGGKRFDINGINRSTGGGELVIYTVEYGRRNFSGDFEMGFWINNNRVRSFVSGNDLIPAEGYVIGARGSPVEIAKQFELGQLVDIICELIPDWYESQVIHAIGGGSRLVKDWQSSC